MTMKNGKAKPASKISRPVKMEVSKEEVIVKITDKAMDIIFSAIQEKQNFQQQAQIADKKAVDNIIIAIEGAGYSADEYSLKEINPDTKEIVLIKK